MKKTVGQVIIKTVSILFTIFFSIILINTIFFNRTISINYNIPFMIIGSFLLYIVILFISYKYKKEKFSFIECVPSKIKILCIVLIIFLIQCILATLTCATWGWDCGIVIGNTVRLINGEEFFEYLYFAKYPNNIGILLLVKYTLLAIKIFTNTINESKAFFIMTVFNIIMVDLAAVFTILTIKKILGNKYMYLSLIFIIPLIIFSPYIIIPYTDTLTMLFPILLLYMYTIIKELSRTDIKKYLLILLFGILFSFGVYLKPTVAIILIAILMVEILNLKISNYTKRNILKNVCYTMTISIIFIIGVGIYYTVYSGLKEKTLGEFISEEKYENYSASYTHFLMMGMQQNPDNVEKGKKRLYGAYRIDDVINTFSIKGYKEKQKYNLKVVKERLNNFGVLGYIEFLYNKANWILSDGTFFYGQEGNWRTREYYNQSKVAQIVQQFINPSTNVYKNFTANLMQILWILLTIGLIFSNKKQNNKYIDICKFAVIGIVLFILLFEGRSRYLINHIPIFILVGTYGIVNSLERQNIRNINKNSKKI